ncbi:TonB family protein [Sphingobium sp. CAP-1]|nr:TonB family protein [Sphingobium sp. CAP-1]
MGGAAYSFRIGGPAAASLLVNALLIAALLHLGTGRSHPRTETPALTVLSLALLKGMEEGEEEAPAATPAVAAAQPASPAPTMIEPRPRPATMAAMAPAPSPVSIMPIASIAAPAPAALEAGAGRSAPTPSPAAPPPAVTRRGAADGLDANAPSGASRSYAARVRSWLYAHRIYPRRAKMRHEEGRVQVRFVIDRAGALLEGAVVRGSGNASLDDEAGAMLRRAAPYPRAPADVPGDRIEFLAPIDFILPA